MNDNMLEVCGFHTPITFDAPFIHFITFYILLFFSCREYYLLIHAYEDFQELLVTAIVDTPPEYDNEVSRGPGFTIQRMGKPN